MGKQDGDTSSPRRDATRRAREAKGAPGSEDAVTGEQDAHLHVTAAEGGAPEPDPDPVVGDHAAPDAAGQEAAGSSGEPPSDLRAASHRVPAVRGSADSARRGGSISTDGIDGEDHSRAMAFGSSALPAADLKRYAEILRERWLLILTVAAVVLLAVAIGTFMQTPVYRATGAIEIRPSAAVTPDGATGRDRISEQYLETQYEILGSAQLARRVVDGLRLTAVPEFNPAAASGESNAQDDQVQMEDDARERAVRRFVSRLTIDPVRGSALVRIHFDSEDPHLATRAVQAVISEYVTFRVAAARNTVESLTGQVGAVQGRLAVAEEQLQEFASDNDLVIMDTDAGPSETLMHDRLRRLEQEVTEAEAARFELEPRRDLARSRGSAMLQSPVLSSLDVRAAELRADYARLRTTFTDSFPETRRVRSQLDAVNQAIAAERARLAAGIAGEYEAAVRRQELVEGASKRQRTEMEAAATKLAEYRILERDVQAQRDIYAGLQRQRREAEVAAAVAPTEVDIAETPVAPRSPSRPDPSRSLPIGAAIGLLFGVSLAFLREHLDDRVRGLDELRSLSSRPVLAMIPARRRGSRFLGDHVDRDGPRRLRVGEDEPSLAEAFRALRTSVLFDLDGPLPSSLLVTSAHPGEGKSTTAVNLAVSLARLRPRVLLIDADLRRAVVAREFRIEGRGSLIDYLERGGDWRRMLRLDEESGLRVLVAGSTAENPAELLSGERIGTLIREAEAEYDVVIIDSPALLVNVADTRLLAPHVGGCIVVARSGVTHLDALERVLSALPNIVGVVLNDLDAQHFPSYYRDYRRPDVEELSRSLRSRRNRRSGHDDGPVPPPAGSRRTDASASGDRASPAAAVAARPHVGRSWTFFPDPGPSARAPYPDAVERGTSSPLGNGAADVGSEPSDPISMNHASGRFAKAGASTAKNRSASETSPAADERPVAEADQQEGGSAGAAAPAPRPQCSPEDDAAWEAAFGSIERYRAEHFGRGVEAPTEADAARWEESE